MLPRIQLATATVPDGGTLRLMKRGDEFSIMLGGNELMNSRLSGSEEALGALACGRVSGRPRAAVLIGGLGMGFTLRAALAALGSDARVVVAEIVGEVVEWARGPMAPVFAGSLDDPRVEVAVADVAAAIAVRDAYDAILLDVDNGPDGLSRNANDGLYAPRGLQAAREALRRGGVLAVWSSGADPRFAARLARAGFAVDEVVAHARGDGRGARHVIWVATRKD